MLPHHPPEIVLGAGQRALSGDVLPAVVVTRHVAGVDVVGAGVVLQVRQLHSGRIIGQDVVVTVLPSVLRHSGNVHRLVSSNILQILKLLREQVVGVGL